MYFIKSKKGFYYVVESVFLDAIVGRKVTDLSPLDGQQKSFYKKAQIVEDPNGNKTLYSYGTRIMEKTADGELKKYWNGWSMTTGKHIKAFCGLNKKEYDAL